MNNKHCTQKEHVRFLLQSADIRAGVIKLQEVLSPFGFDIQLKVAGGFFCPDGNELEISWNEKAIHQRRTRNAGRPFEACSVSWEQIDGWRDEGMTSGEIAEKLHVSRATYYNHLKWRAEYPDYPCF